MKGPTWRILRLGWLPLVVLFYSLLFGSFIGVGLIGAGAESLARKITGGNIFDSLLLSGAYFYAAAILPLSLGLAFAQAFQEFFHCPFSLFLPAARQRMVRGHVCLVGATAVVLTVAIHFLRPGASPWGSLGVTLAALSCLVPLDPHFRWQGSRAAFWAVCGVLILGSWNAWRLPALLDTYGVVAGLGGGGFAVLCFGLRYSRERLRRQATQPLLTLLGVMGDGAAWARWQSHRWSMARISGRAGVEVLLPRVDGSTWSWVRLLFHEAYGKTRVGKRSVLLGPLFMLPFFILMGFFFTKLFPDLHAAQLEAHRPTARALAHQRHDALSFMPGILMLIVSLIWSSKWPRWDALLPLARRQRFYVLATWSAVLEGLVLAMFLAALVGEIGGEILGGAGNFAAMWLRLKVGLLLGLVMGVLALGAVFHRSLRQLPAAFLLCGLAWCTPVIGLALLPNYVDAVFSLWGIFLSGLLAVGLHVAYFQRVRAACLRGDLVFRSS